MFYVSVSISGPLGFMEEIQEWLSFLKKIYQCNLLHRTN